MPRGLDVGAVPGAEVFSPVDGKVVSLEQTEIAGKYKDVEIQIQVANDPTLVLVVSHIADVGVELGDGVTQGDTSAWARSQLSRGCHAGAQPLHLRRRGPCAVRGLARESRHRGAVMTSEASRKGVAVPQAGFAVIGGSGSLAADFPAGLDPSARVLERELVFDTPWGASPPFALFERDGRRALHVRMHGWRAGVSRGRASRQVFSVLHRAGVRRILSDAGVGSLNALLDPGDLVVPDDFVDVTTDRDRLGPVVGDHLLIMRDAVCGDGARGAC